MLEVTFCLIDNTQDPFSKRASQLISPSGTVSVNIYGVDQSHLHGTPPLSLEPVSRAFVQQIMPLVGREHGTPDISVSNTDEDWRVAFFSGHRKDVIATLPKLLAFLSTQPPLDVLVFDACAMMSLNVAHTLVPVGRWFIGSPGALPLAGMPYWHLLHAVASTSIGHVTDLVHALATEMSKFYSSRALVDILSDSVELSICDLSFVETFSDSVATVFRSDVVRREAWGILRRAFADCSSRVEVGDLLRTIDEILASSPNGDVKTCIRQLRSVLLCHDASNSCAPVFVEKMGIEVEFIIGHMVHGRRGSRSCVPTL